MSFHLIWRRLIRKEVPLSYHPLSMTIFLLPPLAFDAKPKIKTTHFYTQTVASSTTPLSRGALTEFLVNKCSLTEEDVRKTLGYRKVLGRLKTIQNLEEVLKLLYGCGLTTPAQIRKVVLYNPRVFFYISETKLKSMLSFLRTFMKEEDVPKLVYTYPSIFNYSEDRVRSAISLLQKLGVEGEFLSYLLARQPRLVMSPEEKVMESFKQIEDLGVKKRSKVFAAALRGFWGVGKETIDRKLQCLRRLGFSEKQILEIASKKPYILGYSEEHLKGCVDFHVNSLGLPLSALVRYAPLFSLSLEKRMIPRYRVMEALRSMQVVKTETNWPKVFMLSEKGFLEKYVNSNDKYCSIVQDIYHGGKVGKLIIDKETCSESVSVKKIKESCEISSSASI